MDDDIQRERCELSRRRKFIGDIARDRASATAADFSSLCIYTGERGGITGLPAANVCRSCARCVVEFDVRERGVSQKFRNV